MGVEIEKQTLAPSGDSYGNGLTGVETMPRDAYLALGMALGTSGLMKWAYFTPQRTVTCTKIVTSAAGTAAGATPTMCRIGFYSVAANGDMTLVCRSANNTGLWATINAEYEEAMATAGGYPSSYTFVAGQRYAGAAICVSGATIPTLAGHAFPNAAMAVREPRLVGQLSGQTDLPASIAAGSVANGGQRLWLAAVA